MGVSRMGSGSHIFASYLPLREKWFADKSEKELDPFKYKGMPHIVEFQMPPIDSDGPSSGYL